MTTHARRQRGWRKGDGEVEEDELSGNDDAEAAAVEGGRRGLILVRRFLLDSGKPASIIALSSCPAPIIVAACDDGDVVWRGGWVRWDRPIRLFTDMPLCRLIVTGKTCIRIKLYEAPESAEPVAAKGMCCFLCSREEVV